MMVFSGSDYYLKEFYRFFHTATQNSTEISVASMQVVTDQDTAVAHYYLWKFLGTVSVDVDDDCDASLKLMAIGYARCQHPAKRGSTICGRLLHMYV